MLFLISDDDYEDDFFVDAETIAEAVELWKVHVREQEDLISEGFVGEPDKVFIVSRDAVIR